MASTPREGRDPLHRYRHCPVEHFSRWRAVWYLFVLRAVCRPILVLTRRPEVVGREHVPKRGPFLIASNHIDMFDPVVVAHAIDQPVAFFAKQELFRIPVLRELFRFLGTFALDRNHVSSTTVKTALNVLRSTGGWSLCIFPEGTRSRTGTLLPFRKGVGGIAARTQLPVVPLGIRRNLEGRFVIAIGEPIADISDPDVLQSRIERSVASLVDASAS
ncbi:MAG: 1-acyl-sn-glycerol-3-phosphate acyltransferase [Acidobacteriota bacterium]|nr:1-acyl-sn-glycerol-3-phosphate acyltransferase [Acidobacteriota bacterium]